MSGATDATDWNWKPIDVRVRKTSARTIQRLAIFGHDSGPPGAGPRPPWYYHDVPRVTTTRPPRPQEAAPMTTQQRHAIPVDPNEWIVPSRFDSLLRWEYEDGRASLLNLYEKGKERQWNGNTRIDWSLDLDPENPQELPDEQISIFGSDIWNKLTPGERANLRRHLQAQQLSQFMHGEQGALLCAAKIVQQLPSVDAKFYAATQVMDEARHVEVYARLLHDKFELAYPITPTLKTLLDQVLSDARWDITYLGMQVLIEGLALAAFASIRDHA